LRGGARVVSVKSIDRGPNTVNQRTAEAKAYPFMLIQIHGKKERSWGKRVAKCSGEIGLDATLVVKQSKGTGPLEKDDRCDFGNTLENREGVSGNRSPKISICDL